MDKKLIDSCLLEFRGSWLVYQSDYGEIRVFGNDTSSITKECLDSMAKILYTHRLFAVEASVPASGRKRPCRHITENDISTSRVDGKTVDEVYCSICDITFRRVRSGTIVDVDDLVSR